MNRLLTTLCRAVSRVALPTFVFVGSAYVLPSLTAPAALSLLTYFWYRVGTSSLHLAVRTGNLTIVERVLSLNPTNLLSRDHLNGYTPLEWAIQDESTEIAQFLRNQMACTIRPRPPIPAGYLTAPCA